MQDGEIGVAHDLRDAVLAAGPRLASSQRTALVAAPQRLTDIVLVPAILEDGPWVVCWPLGSGCRFRTSW